MLTTRHIEEVMGASLQSPLALCSRLGLKPCSVQWGMLDRLAEQPNRFDIQLDEPGATLRAAAMYALWRVLAYQNSRATVLSASKSDAHQFMQFLHRVTVTIDPAMNAVVRWPRWNVLKVGLEPGHELRLVPNKPACAAGRRAGVHTVVVLGAGASNPNFVETLRVLAPQDEESGKSAVLLW